MFFDMFLLYFIYFVVIILQIELHHSLLCDKLDAPKVDWSIARMIAPENGLTYRITWRSWKQNSELVVCGVCHGFKVKSLTVPA